MKTIILLFALSFSFSAFSQIRCKAITKKGTQCTRFSVSDSLCNQHLHSSHLLSDSLVILTGKNGGKYYLKDGVKHYIKTK